MPTDNNIPVLTDLIEKGKVEDQTRVDVESTELLMEEDTEITDGTEVMMVPTWILKKAG